MKALTNAVCVASFASIAIAQQLGSSVPSLTATIATSVQLVRPDGATKATTSTRVFLRDGAGRTRTEEGNQVTIYDPVAHSTVNLDLAKQVAIVKQGVSSSPASDVPQPGAVQTSGGSAASVPIGSGPKVRQKPVVKLGQQQLGGVAAVGYRAELIMPPGSIGNIQPMRHVSEMWRSAALQLTVKRSTTDSEILISGDRLAKQVVETYTNITTPATLDPSLFAIPKGFTIGNAAPGR